MNPRAELLERIITVCVKLDSAILEHFADQLETLPVAPTTQLLNGLANSVIQPDARASLAGLMKKWRKEARDVTPRELAWAIRAANSADNFQRQRQSLELVWTGPVSKESTFRRTDQALLEMIQQAKTSIIIVTFAAYKVPELAAALVSAAKRGVAVLLILESTEESDGAVTFNAIKALGSELARAATIYAWPMEKREKDAKGNQGALHVKCAVVDNEAVLISSANLTEHAMNLNMELGLLVKGGDMPVSLAFHLRSLIQSRVLVQVEASEP